MGTASKDRQQYHSLTLRGMVCAESVRYAMMTSRDNMGWLDGNTRLDKRCPLPGESPVYVVPPDGGQGP
jgi:hypothetical protein